MSAASRLDSTLNFDMLMMASQHSKAISSTAEIIPMQDITSINGALVHASRNPGINQTKKPEVLIGNRRTQ